MSELPEGRSKPDEVIILPLESAARSMALLEMLMRLEKYGLKPPIRFRVLDCNGDEIAAWIEDTDFRESINQLARRDVFKPMYSTAVVTFWMLEDSRGTKLSIKIELEGHKVN